jgi:quinol monooxygenase YgiN
MPPAEHASAAGSNVVELRQYTLHPGRRDELVELFDRHFVESQEEVGMRVLGQFRDLDRPDRFVWLRGFPDMTARAASLAAFYERHPAWREHGAAANATMIDSDDVLLLRPVDGGAFPEPAEARPPVGTPTQPATLYQATIAYLDAPADQALIDEFERHVRPALHAAGGTPTACLQTEPAANTYPRLPVCTGGHVLVWLTRFPGPGGAGTPAPGVELPLPPELTGRLARAPEQLRLAPTPRSLLR